MTEPLTALQQMWTLPEQVDAQWAARRALAGRLRVLNDRCVRSESAPDVLAAALALVDEAIALLPAGRTAAEAYADLSYLSAPTVYVDRGALMGRSNPVAPPMAVRWEDGKSVCDITLGEAYVGAPGMVHGGIVAAMFDQLCGHNAVMHNRPGLTTTLQISYPRPTRVGRPLRMVAQLESTDGRRSTVHGTCYDGDTITATAVAVFIELNAERARAVFTAGGT